MKIAFDNEAYVSNQSAEILERIGRFDKLYLEFGGKLFDDLHASRVLPGFDPNVKTRLLLSLKDKVEIIVCISAPSIEDNKRRADYGISYDADLLRLISSLRDIGIFVGSAVITQYSGQRSADSFVNKLERMGERVFVHRLTKGYPNDVSTIVSDDGYGANPYIPTSRPLVVVTAPGPAGGKLATCLSQLYHEHKRGVKAGYAKYESFPVWNLPLSHPLNVAYEAATADIGDFNMLDSYHLEEYGVSAVSYNRDMAVFPVVKNIMRRILGRDAYKSPTDMGVNAIADSIMDGDAVKDAARQEIIRRYYRTLCDYKQGLVSYSVVQRAEMLMSSQNLSPSDRKVVEPALRKQRERECPACALQLPDGSIVRGKNGDALDAAAAVVINAMKKHINIDQKLLLLSPRVIEPILDLKKSILRDKRNALNLSEVLIALAVSTPMNTTIAEIVKNLRVLRGCEAHSTVMLDSSEIQALQKLGIRMTCEPEYTY